MNLFHSPATLRHQPLLPLPRTARTLALTLLCATLAALTPRAAANNWEQNAAPGSPVDYLRLEELRSFYKFAPDTVDRRSGTRRVSNGPTTIVFGPDARDISIHGIRCKLSHPARTNERGEFILSKTDVVKLIDPVLRPTYIAKRREVKTIVIDPGHGGHDVGHQTPQVREADCTLSLARQLANQLRQRGYEVILTREDNRYLSDQRRIDSANSADNAIFLSLHLNSGRSDFHGIETYTVAPFTPPAPLPADAAAAAPTGSDSTPANTDSTPASAPSAAASTVEDTTTPMPGNEQDAANMALAYSLQSALISSTGAQDGGCRRTRYSLLSSVRCPAAIIELGYATHAEEGAALNTEEYRSTLALALANGVDAFARAMKPGAKPPVTIAPPPPAPTPVKVDKLGKDDDKKTDSSKGGKKKAGSGSKTTRKSKSKSKSSGKSGKSGSSWKRSGRNKRTGRKR